MQLKKNKKKIQKLYKKIMPYQHVQHNQNSFH